MSRDADPQQRLWLSLGYGGKTAVPSTWRYWKTADQTWVIAAPNDLAHFELRNRSVYYRDKEIFTERTQWAATWKALAYFYSEVIGTVKPPPLS